MSARATLLAVAASALSVNATPLPPANVVASEITTSGISAGAFLASQFHVAFSANVAGCAMLAGGPYYCAQNEMANALTVCMQDGSLINVGSLVSYANFAAELGGIDNTTNLASARVWTFSAFQDSVVATNVVQAAGSFYSQFIPATNITFLQRDGEHTQQTLNYGNDCGYLGSPYIGKCGFDAAGSQLQWMYDNALTPPSNSTSAHLATDAARMLAATQGEAVAGAWSLGNGQLVTFDQTAFVPGYSSFTGLGPLGYVYIPSACNATTAAAGAPACRLHVAWHGCNQYAGTIGGTYVLFAGYLEWAAQNNLVVLFPQAATTLSNPEGCFDWWGYTNGDYALKSGVQMSAVWSMVQTLASGSR